MAKPEKLKIVILATLVLILSYPVFLCVRQFLGSFPGGEKYDKFVDILSAKVHLNSNKNNGLMGRPDSISQIENCEQCSAITCRKLLFGKAGDPIYKLSRDVMRQYSHRINGFTDINLVKLAENCSKFKQARGYHMESSEEEAYFPLAFIILAHRDVEQTERLLRSIYRPQNVYCIHIDVKSQTLLYQMKHIVKCFDNVFIASKLENVYYGGYSRLQADINCVRDLVASNVKWKYVFNLAATAFPLKSNWEMVKTLQIYNGSNDMEYLKTSGDAFLENRFKLKHLEMNGRVVRTIERYTDPPHNLTIVKGKTYGVFSRAFMEFATTDPRAKDFLEWCRFTETPDEHFWHTLHMTSANPHINAPGGYSGGYVPKVTFAVFTVWEGDGIKCHGKIVHSFCIFGVEDFPTLTSPDTQHHFFVNKFHKELEPLALECMENWINYKVLHPPPIDSEFYDKLPFVQRKS